MRCIVHFLNERTTDRCFLQNNGLWVSANNRNPRPKNKVSKHLETEENIKYYLNQKLTGNDCPNSLSLFLTKLGAILAGVSPSSMHKEAMTAAACPYPYRMPVREAQGWPSDHCSNNDRQPKSFHCFGISARIGMDATVLGLEIPDKWICRHGEDLPVKL